MKKTYTGLLAVLLTASLCTSCGTKTNDDVAKEEEPQELEIEEEYDIQTEEGEVGGGL